MGRGTDSCEDEGLRVAAACFGGEVRVCGVDAGQAPQAFAIRSIEEREEKHC